MMVSLGFSPPSEAMLVVVRGNQLGVVAGAIRAWAYKDARIFTQTKTVLEFRLYMFASEAIHGYI